MKHVLAFVALCGMALSANAQPVSVLGDLNTGLLRGPKYFLISNILEGAGIDISTNGAHNANGVVVAWEGGSVQLGPLADHEALVWDDAGQVWTNAVIIPWEGGPLNLGTLSDRQVLTWDSGHNVWTNAAPSALARTNSAIVYVETNGFAAGTAIRGRSDLPFSSLVEAAAAAQAGDTIRLGAGTFYVTGNRVAVPDNVALVGQGMHATTIIGNAQLLADSNGPIVNPGDNSYIGHLSISSTNESNFGAPIGVTSVSAHPCTNVIVEGARLFGNTDNVYIDTTNLCNLTFIGCVLLGTWDNVFIDGNTNSLIQLAGCLIYGTNVVDLPNNGNEVRNINCYQGRIRIDNCRLEAYGGTQYRANIYTAHADARVWLNNSSLEVGQTGGYWKITNNAGSIFIQGVDLAAGDVVGAGTTRYPSSTFGSLTITNQATVGRDPTAANEVATLGLLNTVSNYIYGVLVSATNLLTTNSTRFYPATSTTLTWYPKNQYYTMAAPTTFAFDASTNLFGEFNLQLYSSGGAQALTLPTIDQWASGGGPPATIDAPTLFHFWRANGKIHGDYTGTNAAGTLTAIAGYATNLHAQASNTVDIPLRATPRTGSVADSFRVEGTNGTTAFRVASNNIVEVAADATSALGVVTKQQMETATNNATSYLVGYAQSLIRSVVPTNYTVWSEDFSGTLSNWEIENGTWAISSGQLRAESASYSPLRVIRYTNWVTMAPNWVAKCTVTPLSTNVTDGFGIGLRTISTTGFSTNRNFFFRFVFGLTLPGDIYAMGGEKGTNLQNFEMSTTNCWLSGVGTNIPIYLEMERSGQSVSLFASNTVTHSIASFSHEFALTNGFRIEPYLSYFAFVNFAGTAVVDNASFTPKWYHPCTVLVIGDSTASGIVAPAESFMTPQDAWPYVLRNRMNDPGIQAYTCGSSGYHSVARVIPEINLYNADKIISAYMVTDKTTALATTASNVFNFESNVVHRGTIFFALGAPQDDTDMGFLWNFFKTNYVRNRWIDIASWAVDDQPAYTQSAFADSGDGIHWNRRSHGVAAARAETRLREQ